MQQTATVVVLAPEGRVCNTCKIAKPLFDFQKDRTGTFGKKSRCKVCCNELGKSIYRSNPNVRRSGIKNRPDKLKRLYGITYADVVRTLDNQLGRCANIGCGKEITLEVKGTKKNRAVIDHSHKTGRFRAMLCMPCNRLLGTLETKGNVVRGLMQYLITHQE